MYLFPYAYLFLYVCKLLARQEFRSDQKMCIKYSGIPFLSSFVIVEVSFFRPPLGFLDNGDEPEKREIFPLERFYVIFKFL